MLALRAYLWVVRSETDAVISTHRDLESLRLAWREAGTDGTLSGIIHVGFTRPNTSDVLPLAVEYPGRVLLTAAARFALVGLSDVAPLPAREIDGQPVYVAISAWGYTCTAEELGLSEHKFHQGPATSDWVASLSVADANLAGIAAAAGIRDEGSYQAYEYRLPPPERKALGLFRVTALGCPEDADDPQLIVRCAPPWLLRRDTSSLDLTTRIANVLQNEHIAKVSDLARYTQQQFLDLPNFGRRSLRALADILLAALDEGPNADTASGHADLPPLLLLLRTTLSELSERSAHIMRRRMGLDVPPATLQEVGDELGLTRERVRQIEAKHIRDTSRAFGWSKFFVAKVSSLLAGRQEPLPVEALPHEDEWFVDIPTHPAVLAFLIEAFSGDRFHVLDIGGRSFLTELSSTDWSEAVRDGQRILEGAVGQGWLESQARQSVEALLTGRGHELRTQLWLLVSQKAHFASSEAGEPVLTGYGRAIENVVEVILTESAEPLHYSEITVRASARLGRTIDARRVRNAAAEVGYLYGLGTFGLARHYPFSDEEGGLIAGEIEAAVVAGKPGRQWHCAELVEMLASEGFDFDERLTAYLVNIALLRWSQDLAYLGRLVWSAANGKVLSTGHRIDVHQALVSILREAGMPLKTSELKERLIEARGLGVKFQIHPEAPLCRVGNGKWGLLDRDVGLSAEVQHAVVDAIKNALQEKGSGLHSTELREAVPVVLRLSDAGIELSTIVGLATLGSQIKMSSERYLYLELWEGARRPSLHEVLKVVLERGPSEGLSLEEVANGAATGLGRSVSRPSILSKLQAVGARWDEATRRWLSPMTSEAGEV